MLKLTKTAFVAHRLAAINKKRSKNDSVHWFKGVKGAEGTASGEPVLTSLTEGEETQAFVQEDLGIADTDPDFADMDYRQFSDRGSHEDELESTCGVPSSDSGISEASNHSRAPLSPGACSTSTNASSTVLGIPDGSRLSAFSAARQKSVLDDSDLARIQLFHNSRKNVVHVCRCMVTLYKCSVTPKKGSSEKDEWKRVDEGALLLQMERDSDLPNWFASASLTLAKPLSGFDIWKDSLTRDSRYEAHNQSFHSVVFSKNRLIKYGFLFSHNPSAFDFQSEVTKCLANNEELLSFDKKERKRRIKATKRIRKRLDIHDISIPLDYRHITCLDSKLVSDPRDMSETAKEASLY